jgi:acetyltransferase-like isoleucine patch superfamily enzyme
MIVNEGYVKLGSNCKIDEGALVGYMPSRRIIELELIIGDGAIIRSGSVIYLGSRIGRGLETGHNVIIREGNKLGDYVKVWSNTVIDYDSKIGNNVKIHCNCYIAQLTVIEDDVFIAPGVMIANEKYPTGVFNSERIKGPIIKQGAKIGIGAIIMPGVVIGENSLIGAGSLVTKDIPSGTVAYGVPARVVKNIAGLTAYG